MQKACPSPADQAKVLSVTSALCAAAGAPIKAPAPVESSAAPAPAPTSAEVASYAEASSSVAPTVQTSGECSEQTPLV